MKFQNKVHNEENVKRQGLTDSQAKGLAKLVDWFEGNSSSFTLYGAAGTGKTFLLKRFLDEYVKFGIAVTAPTHKAVTVVEKSTNRKGRTFQSLHGLRPNFNLEDFNIDNFRFDTLGKPLIQNYRLVIVDECSQISYDLHKLNMTRSKQFSTKILYVGDMLQLPPITKKSKNRLSPVFDLENKHELTEIVRQKEDNPLLKVLTILRNDIQNQSNRFLSLIAKQPFSINVEDEGYVCLPLKDFQIALYKRFKEQKKNPEYVKYAAYTNGNIKKWNEFLRKTLYKPTDILIQEDLLLGYNTIIDPNNFMESILTNSIDYTIDNLTRRKSDYGFDVFVTDINNGSKTKTIMIVDHKSNSFRKFYNEISKLHRRALFSQPSQRSRFWSEYYDFKNRYLSLINFHITDNDGVKRGTVKKDIDYGYGMTIHKLQGSTIEYIYLNTIDICYLEGDKSRPISNSRSNPYAIEMRNRLLYTGLSRASRKAILLI